MDETIKKLNRISNIMTFIFWIGLFGIVYHFNDSISTEAYITYLLIIMLDMQQWRFSI